MLNCRDVTEQVTEYLEGKLSWQARWQFRLHLAMCRFCRRYVEQFRLTIQAVRRMGPGAPSESDRATPDVVEQFRAWKKESGR